MSKDLLVTMYCTNPKHLFDQYMQQLKTAGIDIYVERVTSFPNENSGGTAAWKVESFRRRALMFRDYEKIVYTCAWDMLFYGTKAEVMAKIPDDGVILGAERNCYPDADLAPKFKGDTPWRFVNGGPMAGSPQAILDWLDAFEHHPLYRPQEIDQRILNWMRAEDSPLTPLDDCTELFYCLAAEQGDLDFERGLPVNKLCGTHPNFLHFNGRSPVEPVMELYERSLR